MALSKQAEVLKAQMGCVVAHRRELGAVEQEWRELLAMWEEAELPMMTASLALAKEICRQRYALRRVLTAEQLVNWSRISGCAALSPFQRRVLGMRYVRGCSWGDMTVRLSRARQYLLREHNKGLERLVQAASEATPRLPAAADQNGD